VKLEERFRLAVAKSDFQLPMLPASTQRVLAAFGPDSTANSVAKAVEGDPSISARVMKLANSAFYKGAAPARTVVQGVVRVGMRSVQNLVNAEAQKPLYASRDPRIAAYLGKLWTHSICTAVAAQELALKARSGEAPVAFLAGLLHDVGKTALLPLLPLPKSDAEPWPPEDELELVHCRAGQHLLQKWNLPGDIGAAILSHHAKSPVGSNARFVATIALANALAHAVGMAPAPDPVATAAAPDWARLVGIGDADLAVITETLAARAGELSEALAG
jgi:HD-like signal output (HDOD) protein